MSTDPKSLSGIDAEMADALAKGQELLPGGIGDITSQPVELTRQRYAEGRAYWNEDGPRMPRSAEHNVAGPHGPIPVRISYPAADGVLPCLVYFHGGGFMYGNIDTHDKICRWIAGRSGAAVCSVDYRLAPEHRFPVPLDEAEAVLNWLSENAAALDIDPTRLGLGGDSAGASISLGTAYTMKEKQSPLFAQLKVLALFYGNYGLGNDTKSVQLYGGEDFGLSDRTRAYFRKCYVGDPVSEAERYEDPRLKLINADLKGIPYCFLGAAELDPLCDNTPALASRLDTAGVSHSVHIYDGVLHGFLHMTKMVTKSRKALDAAGDAVARAFYG